MGDTRQLRARVDVDERDIAKLRLSAPSIIRVPAFAGRDFTGKIVEIGDAWEERTFAATTRSNAMTRRYSRLSCYWIPLGTLSLDSRPWDTSLRNHDGWDSLPFCRARLSVVSRCRRRFSSRLNSLNHDSGLSCVVAECAGFGSAGVK